MGEGWLAEMCRWFRHARCLGAFEDDIPYPLLRSGIEQEILEARAGPYQTGQVLRLKVGAYLAVVSLVVGVYTEERYTVDVPQ